MGDTVDDMVPCCFINVTLFTGKPLTDNVCHWVILGLII